MKNLRHLPPNELATRVILMACAIGVIVYILYLYTDGFRYSLLNELPQRYVTAQVDSTYVHRLQEPIAAEEFTKRQIKEVEAPLVVRDSDSSAYRSLEHHYQDVVTIDLYPHDDPPVSFFTKKELLNYWNIVADWFRHHYLGNKSDQ